MRTIDLNADMGEAFGAWSMGDDEGLLAVVSSANVACGFHAGDPTVIGRTVAVAARQGVAVGAHPSLPDLQGFGRRVMRVDPDEAYDMVLYQVAAVAGMARARGTALHHVKPHGALYHMAAEDPALARAIAAAVHDFDPGLVLYALSGSRLAAEGDAAGLRTAHEVFADRGYRSDGGLVPRSDPAALIHEPDRAVAQVLAMVGQGRVRAVDGQWVPVRADTVCVHGDSARAVALARALRTALQSEGFTLAAP